MCLPDGIIVMEDALFEVSCVFIFFVDDVLLFADEDDISLYEDNTISRMEFNVRFVLVEDGAVSKTI
jgi:hypothetical protein